MATANSIVSHKTERHRAGGVPGGALGAFRGGSRRESREEGLSEGKKYENPIGYGKVQRTARTRSELRI